MKYFISTLCILILIFGYHTVRAQFTISGPETICTGTPATLTAANCGGALKWSTGETTPSITVSPTATTTYYVTCTVGNAITTGSLTPIVVPGLQLNSDVGTCISDQATLSVPGVPIGSNLRWEKDGVPIPGAGSNTYTATQPGTYTVKSDIPTAAWTWQNPLPDGENFNDIFFATDLLGVAVGDYGKIMRTTDGGQTWSRVVYADKFDLTSVHFTGPLTGWITGRENVVLKTMNGGLTWSRIYLNGNYQNLSKVYFVDADHGWILDRSIGGILKTNNGGYTWDVASTFSNTYVQDFYFADASNGWMTIGSQVKKTIDGGISWNTVLTASEYGQFYKVFFLDASVGWAVGRRGLHKTTDGGSTWTDHSGAVPFGIEFTDVHFADENNGIVVSGQGIYRTTDGGKAWNLTDSPSINAQAVFMRSAQKAWVAGWPGRLLTGNEGTSSPYHWTISLGQGPGTGFGVYRAGLDFVSKDAGWAINSEEFLMKTTDGGKVWINTTLKDVYDVDFVDANTGYATAKGQAPFPASVYKSTDGGNTWTNLYNFPADYSPQVQFVNSSVGWAINFSQDIYRTTDGGASWTISPVGFNATHMFFTDANNGWVAGYNGKLSKTTDGGLNWTSVNAGINTIGRIYFKNSLEGWITGTPTRKTTDGGITWTDHYVNGNRMNFIDLDFADVNTGLALAYNLNNDGGLTSYRTYDGGAIWLPVAIPSRTQFGRIKLADASNGWVASGQGTIMHYTAYAPTCSASITLQQSAIAPVVTTSTHNALCEGESITLTAGACPSGGTLSWSDGSTGSTITVTPYSSTTYTAFCDIGNGCKGATYTGVAVIPKIRLDTASTAPCNRPVLTATNFWSGIDLRWRKDGTVVPDQLGQRLSTATPGSYTAEPGVAGAWASQTGRFTNNYLNDITFANPTIGFAVGFSGVILKTSDGGTSWKTLPSGVTTDFSRIIAASPQVVWAFGTYGGLIKTTDGGDTWVEQDLGYIYSLTDLSFASENVGWALGRIGTIFHTSNGGATWTSQPADLSQSYRAIHAVDINTAFAVSNRKISRTTDGGASWTTVDSPGNSALTDVYFTDASHGWAVGGSAIIHTEDGGNTWLVQSPPNSPQGAWYFGQVQFVDKMNGWIKDSFNYILSTNDGGQTWKVTRGLDINSSSQAMRFFMKTPTEGFVVGNRSLLAHTTDGAATFQKVGNALEYKILNKIHFVSNDAGFVVGANGYFLKTENGGKNWQISTIPHTGTWSVTDAFFADASHGWIINDSGSMYRTADGGTTWTQSQPTNSSSQLMGLYFIDSTIGWVVGSAGKILKTTDGGFNWIPQTSNTTKNLTHVFFLDANRGWAVGNQGAFLGTVDGGTTWTPRDIGYSNSNFPIQSITFTSPANGWLIVAPYNLLHTTDGGLSWQEVYPDGEFRYSVTYKVQFVDDSTGFVLRDQFLYVTKDGGVTWQKTYPYYNLGMHFTDATHGWVIGEFGSILAYHPAAASCPSDPITVQPQSIQPLSTLISGNWNTPAVWSCGSVPTALDDVRINSEHTITLPAGYSAASRSIELLGKIQQDANSSLRIGQE